MASKQSNYTSEFIFQRRVCNFKKIKRAYYSLLLIVGFYMLSFFRFPYWLTIRHLPFIITGTLIFPALGDLFGVLYQSNTTKLAFLGKRVQQPAQGEANYRELKKQFNKEEKGNWVLMPYTIIALSKTY